MWFRRQKLTEEVDKPIAEKGWPCRGEDQIGCWRLGPAALFIFLRSEYRVRRRL
jgi:hypothetical protein